MVEISSKYITNPKYKHVYDRKQKKTENENKNRKSYNLPYVSNITMIFKVGI
jgi:hypothetical protein